MLFCLLIVVFLPFPLAASGFPEATELGRDAFARGDYAQAAAHWKTARLLASPADPRSLAVAEANLATLDYVLGRAVAAAAGYREALRHWGAVPEPPRAELVRTLGNLAEVCRSLGEYAEAERLLERLAGIPSSDPEEPQRLRLSQARLAAARGYTARAEELYQQVLRVSTAAPITRAQALDGVGSARLARGRLVEAAEALTEGLALWESTGQTVRAASTANRLGDLWLMRHEPARALPYLRRALAVFEEKGIAGAELASALNNLGQAQRFTGDPRNATVSFERAIETATRDLGPTHPVLAAAYLNLGDLALGRKRYDEAEGLLRRALAMDQQRLGSDHPAVARDLARIAKLHLKMKQYAPAAEELGQALAIRERLGVPFEVEQADWFELRAQLLRRAEQYAEAAQLEAKAMRIRVQNALH